MRKPLPPDTSVDEIEHAFYEALQRGDLEAVMACWADDDDVVCVHPNGQRLVGPAAIRASYAELLANGPLIAQPVDVRLMSFGACTVHSLVEALQVQTDDGALQVTVQATHVYVRTAQGWRLTLHHASPGLVDPPVPIPGGGRVLH